MTRVQLLTLVLIVVLIGGGGMALAVGTIVIPPQRSLGAATLYDETLNPPAPIGIAGAPLHVQQDGASPTGNNGTDRSFNAPSLAGLTLIGTISAYTARIGLEIMVSCAAGAKIVLDDQAGVLTSTIIPLDGPATDGGQGSEWTNAQHAHAGRVRIYSSNASCQVTGREW